MVADNRKVEDSEAKAIKDKLKEESKAGDLLFSVLGIHVLAGREEPTHLPTGPPIFMTIIMCYSTLLDNRFYTQVSSKLPNSYVYIYTHTCLYRFRHLLYID